MSYDPSDLDNLNGQVKVIGHAGMGFSSWLPFNPYPSNSYTSLITALDKGVDGVEVDLHMTADKSFILYHDNELDSKTNQSGCPADWRLEELKELNYRLGAPFDWFQSEQLISLEKLVEELIRRGKTHEIHLDIRSHSACHDKEWSQMWAGILLNKLHAQIQEWKYPADQVYLISYSTDLILKAKQLNLPYHINFEISGDLEEGIQWCIDNEISSITLKPKLLNKELSKRLHDEGIELITFGGRSKQGSKKLLELNPDIIQTDNIEAVKDLIVGD